MKVTELTNGQIVVEHENLKLIHTSMVGIKFNDCTIFDGECYVSVSPYAERFSPLFIALHNFKVNNQLK